MLQTIVETLPGFPLLCFQLPNHGTLQDIYNQTRQRCAALSDKEFSFLLNGRKVENDTCLLSKDGFPLLLKLHVPLLGGKGGFGEVLKAQGQKMSAKKSTNVDDCRDLNGKRIREQREQEEVLEYLKQEPERKRELEERKRKKLEKHLKEPNTKRAWN
ncbi:Sde2 N-terminal domain-containing protein [Gorgonomyces haynaldii]|nr:Sde2 N-terminal domain-containing protein [Gorgonomyces haynaldii]